MDASAPVDVVWPEERRTLLVELSRAVLQVQSLRRQLEAVEGLTEGATGVALLTCTVGAYTVAFPLAVVTEVVLRAQCEPIPDAPPFLLGLLNLHGSRLPVIDVHQRLLGKDSDASASDVIVLVRCHGRSAGLLVQDASSAWMVPRDQLRPLSEDCAFAGHVLACVTVQDRAGYLLSAASLTELPPSLGGAHED